MPDSGGRDFVHPGKWTPFPAWDGAELRRDGVSARPVLGLGQALVTGDLAAARAALAPDAREVGLWVVADGAPALVRIARDRALLVTARPLDREEGWRAEGFAVSPADSAWAVLAIEGEQLLDLMREGTAAPLERGSPSASTLFAGVPCLVYRTSESAARLHVESALAPYVWRWLETRSE